MRRCRVGSCKPRRHRLARVHGGRLAMSAGLGASDGARGAHLKSARDGGALDRGGGPDPSVLPRPQNKSAHFKAARLRGRRVLEAPRSAGREGGLPGAGVGGVHWHRGLRAGCFLFLARSPKQALRAVKNEVWGTPCVNALNSTGFIPV